MSLLVLISAAPSSSMPAIVRSLLTLEPRLLRVEGLKADTIPTVRQTRSIGVLLADQVFDNLIRPGAINDGRVSMTRPEFRWLFGKNFEEAVEDGDIHVDDDGRPIAGYAPEDPATIYVDMFGPELDTQQIVPKVDPQDFDHFTFEYRVEWQVLQELGYVNVTHDSENPNVVVHCRVIRAGDLDSVNFELCPRAQPETREVGAVVC